MTTDLRLALRQLLKTPGFAAVVVAVLALGIGVNVATFGAIDALFFRYPAGVRAPEDVRRIDGVMPSVPGQQIFFNINYSLADVAAMRARRETFVDLGAFTSGTAALTDRSTNASVDPRKLRVTVADRGYFKTLGARPALGRLFTAAEDAAFDGAPVAVVTHAFWQRTFGGARDVLGRTLRLNGRTFTIVGVMAPAFHGTELEPSDVFLPVSMAAATGYQSRFITKPSMKWLHAVARLAPGTDGARAAAVASTVLRGLDAVDGKPVLGFDAKRQRTVRAALLNDHFGQGAFESSSPVPLWMLGATAAVLLVVCANVANLLVARAERRRREMATRLALGAQRSRIVRQLLAEGVVLATAGGVAGLAAAVAGSRLVVLVPGMPALAQIVDARAALFAMVVSLLTTLGFALAPALYAARSDAGELLRAGVRGTARTTPVRTALLAVQFAASLALLGVGGLFVRSLRNVRAVDVGFDLEHTLVASADWDAFGVSAADARSVLARAAERARAMPPVAGAALVSLAPFDGVSMSTLHLPGGGDLSAISGVPGGMFFTNAVDTAYFRTLGIPMLRGHGFTGTEPSDRPNATVVVSETMARRLWPREDALGKCVYQGSGPGMGCSTVIGVVRDARFLSLTDEVSPIFYTSFSTVTDGPAQLVVRLRPGTSDALARRTITALRTAITTLDPRVAYARVGPLGEAMLNGSLAPYRVSAAAFTVFGSVALLLAAIGLYGVVAYAVAQRTGEFGVRVALGARSRDVVALVLGQGVRLIAAGAVVGTIGAVGVGRLLRSRLYGVDPLDLPTLGAVAALLTVVALVACWIPARRAARVDPASALRNE